MGEATAGDLAWIFGLFLAVFGVMFVSLGSVIPPFAGVLPYAQAILALGIVMVIGGVIMKAREKTSPPTSPAPSEPTMTREKETIVKEIVMIPCQYCGALMPQTSVFCPNCGARRKA